MHITDIPKFERLIKNLSINVFELQNSNVEKNVTVPLYISKNNFHVAITDLFLYINHYVLNMKLDAICASSHDHKNYICRKCLSSHRPETNLKEQNMLFR